MAPNPMANLLIPSIRPHSTVIHHRTLLSRFVSGDCVAVTARYTAPDKSWEERILRTILHRESERKFYVFYD